MASARQLKHRARIHAAVLSYLYPPSPPHASTQQVTITHTCEQVCFQAQPSCDNKICSQAPSPKGAELEKCSDHEDDGMEAGRVLLSRAQRKRLKLKKSKEQQSGAIPAKRVIGPCLPDVLEKERHEVVHCKLASVLLQGHGIPEKGEKCLSLLNMENREDVHNVRGNEYSRGAENVQNAGELALYTKSFEEECRHNGAMSEPLTKVKRRRLAKKKFSDNLQSRHPLAGSSFTAEVRQGEIVIKQMV